MRLFIAAVVAFVIGMYVQTYLTLVDQAITKFEQTQFYN